MPESRATVLSSCRTTHRCTDQSLDIIASASGRSIAFPASKSTSNGREGKLLLSCGVRLLSQSFWAPSKFCKTRRGRNRLQMSRTTVTAVRFVNAAFFARIIDCKLLPRQRHVEGCEGRPVSARNSKPFLLIAVPCAALLEICDVATEPLSQIERALRTGARIESDAQRG